VDVDVAKRAKVEHATAQYDKLAGRQMAARAVEIHRLKQMVEQMPGLQHRVTSDAGVLTLTVDSVCIKLHEALPPAPMKQLVMSSDGTTAGRGAPDLPLSALEGFSAEEYLHEIARPSTPCHGCNDVTIQRYKVSNYDDRRGCWGA